MSTTLVITATAYSVQEKKPTTAYGQLATMPLRGGSSSLGAGTLMQTALSKIPANATIVSANIRFTCNTSYTGSHTIQIYRVYGAWPSQVTMAKRPALSDVLATATFGNTNAGAYMRVPVTSLVQMMVAGTARNLGWYATVAATNYTLTVRGGKATYGPPALEVTYTVPPPTPTGLEPSNAAVATDKPTLLFDADANILGLQVQVDPAANATSPAFDSGTVAASGGMLDLTETTYAGLADGASTWWRVRQQTDGGWSPWSAWATFSHAAASALTITSPSGTPDANGNTPVGDGTPPVTWSYAGTQVGWRARLLAENGDVIADSKYNAGTDTDWTPPAGLAKDGQVGLLQVEAWDAVERAATPGHPVEAIATLPIVLTPNTALEAFADVAATDDWFEPLITITGHRSAIPDQVALTRDGVEIARWDGVDVLTADPAGGYTIRVTDPAATMGRAQTWRLVPIVNGTKGPGGDGATLTPHCEGVWLTSVEDPTQRVVVFGTDGEQTQPETSIVHQPLGETTTGQVPVVRRRLIRSSPAGTISGQLVDHPRVAAFDLEDRLRAWVEADAGTRYWLTLGGYTAQVIIGDVVFTEVSTRPSAGRVLGVSIGWWAQ